MHFLVLAALVALEASATELPFRPNPEPPRLRQKAELDAQLCGESVASDDLEVTPTLIDHRQKALSEKKAAEAEIERERQSLDKLMAQHGGDQEAVAAGLGITPQALQLKLLAFRLFGPWLAPTPQKTIGRLEQAERELLKRAMFETRGNRRAASRILQISRAALSNKLERYGFLDETWSSLDPQAAVPLTTLAEMEARELDAAMTRAQGKRTVASVDLGISRPALLRNLRKYGLAEKWGVSP